MHKKWKPAAWDDGLLEVVGLTGTLHLVSGIPLALHDCLREPSKLIYLLQNESHKEVISS